MFIIPGDLTGPVPDYFERHLGDDMIEALVYSQVRYTRKEVPLDLQGNANKAFTVQVSLSIKP